MDVKEIPLKSNLNKPKDWYDNQCMKEYIE